MPILPILAATALILLLSLGLGLGTQLLLRCDETRLCGIRLFLEGVLGLSVLLLICLFILRTGMIVGLSLAGGLSLLAAWQTRKRTDLQLEWDRFSLGAVLVSAIAAVLWSQEYLKGLTQENPATWIHHPWQDTFFHVQVVGIFKRLSFGEVPASAWMVGDRLPLYHYASYFVPAAFARVAGLTDYQAGTALYPVLGMFLGGLAAFVVGKALRSPFAGLCAAVGLLFVPDLSFFRLMSRWNGYFFFQEVGIGGAYGVTALALAWLEGLRALRTAGRERQFALLGLAFWVGVSALFKVQIFLAYSPAFLALGVLALPAERQRLGAGLSISGYLLFAFLIHSIDRAPSFYPSFSGAIENVRQTLRVLPLGGLTGFSRLISWAQEARTVPLLLMGPPLVLFTTYGLHLGSWAWTERKGLSKQSDRPTGAFFPKLIVANHMVIALCISANAKHGDPFEVIHKTFVLPYFVVAVWASALLGHSIQIRNLLSGRARSLALALGALMLGGVALWGRTTQSGIQWPGTCQIPLPNGLVELTRYVREQVPATETVQLAGNDHLFVLGALGEHATTVAHSSINSGPPPALAIERLREIQNLLDAPTWAEVHSRALRARIAWLVLTPQQTLKALPQKPERVAFESEGFRLLDLR